jgi:ABC-type glycerol-3-phosphate transport system substrate-binding protein
MKLALTRVMAGAVAGLTALSLMGGAIAPAQAADDPHLFKETDHSAGGAFLQYWQGHGGLAQQGYPISDEFTEVSDLNGKPYTVQYFERAVFEKHPENKPPFDILLSQLGTYRYKQKYPNGAPNQKAAADGTLFKETGHKVGGKFLKYWQEHGGLAQQGYPISDEFTEVSDLNGKPYTVQYFERAVFELHPENAGTPYEVLLSQLGTFQARKFTSFNNVEIHFWHTQSRANADALNGLVNEFNATHPGIKVIPEFKNTYDDLLKAVQTAGAGGSLPDLSVGYENWMPGFVQSDISVPFDDFLASPGGYTQSELADFFPAFLKTNVYPALGNKMWSFPFTKSMPMLWYNMDMLKAAGISKPPATWDEFVADSKAVAKPDQGIYGYEFEAATSEFIAGIYSRGGTVMNNNDSSFTFNNPAAQGQLKMLTDGVNARYFLVTEPNKFQDEIDFANQKAAFIIRSSTSVSFIKSYYPKTPANYDFNWSGTVIPHGAGVTTPVTTIYGGNVLMYKTTPERERAAWAFVKWFTQPNQNARWAALSGYLPLTKSAQSNYLLQAAWQKEPRLRASFDNLQYATAAEPKVGSYQQVRDIIFQDLQAALSGTKSPEDALSEAQTDSNDTLK